MILIIIWVLLWECLGYNENPAMPDFFSLNFNPLSVFNGYRVDNFWSISKIYLPLQGCR